MFNRDTASVWEDEKVLEMDGGTGLYGSVNALNITQLPAVKWFKWQIVSRVQSTDVQNTYICKINCVSVKN